MLYLIVASIFVYIQFQTVSVVYYEQSTINNLPSPMRNTVRSRPPSLLRSKSLIQIFIHLQLFVLAQGMFYFIMTKIPNSLM